MTARWAVIADDLTGAADSGVHFVGTERNATVLSAPFAAAAARAPVSAHLILDTDSRGRTAGEAVRLVESAGEVARRHGISHWYKKVDSTLKGHIADELAAFLRSVPVREPLCLLCPAVPREGRVVTDGVLRAPNEGRRVNVIRMLRERGLSVECLTDPRVPEETFRRLQSLPTSVQVVVADAGDAEALRVLAAVTMRRGGRELVPAGASGFARALAEECGAGPRVWLAPPSGFAVVVFGSQNPVSIAQAHRLAEARRWPLVLVGPDSDRDAGRLAVPRAPRGGGGVVLLADSSATAASPVDARTIERALANLAAHYLDTSNDAWLLLSGGATARAVLARVGAGALDLRGEISEGVPLGYTSLTSGRRVPVATKAGGFGHDDLLENAFSNHMK